MLSETHVRLHVEVRVILTKIKMYRHFLQTRRSEINVKIFPCVQTDEKLGRDTNVPKKTTCIFSGVCIVWFSKYTGIIFLNSFNWLACVTETHRAYCTVRSVFVYII